MEVLPGPFADAVDGHLGLARTGLDGGQGVGRGQAEVVVAVDAEDGPVDVGGVGAHVGDQVGKFLGDGIADRVGQIDGRRAGVDGGLEDFAEVVAVAPRPVFGGEFHVVRIRLGVFHRGDGVCQNLLAGFLQLVLQVDVRGGDEGVDPRFGGMADGLPGPVDIRLGCPRQAGDLGLFQCAGNLGDRFEISLRGRRETGLDDIDAELFQLGGDAQFFAGIHAGAG